MHQNRPRHQRPRRDDGGFDAVVGLGIDGHVVSGGDRAVMHPRQRVTQDDVERRGTGAADAHAGAAADRKGHRGGQAEDLDIGIRQGLHQHCGVRAQGGAVERGNHRAVDDVARQRNPDRQSRAHVATKSGGQRGGAGKGTN